MRKDFWIYRVLDSYYLYDKTTYNKEDILSEQLDTFDALILHPNNVLSETLMGMKDREIRSITLIIEERHDYAII